jgi:EAL domain-containing protein (putative c-di-GMP-specific phosphodiesterase class I)
MEPELAASRPDRRVLIIDDEPSFCRLMTRLIGDLGYQAKSSCHLNPGDFAELSSSDIIFVDMMMPNTDGIQVLEVLSRHQIKPSIVLMSGVHGDVLAAAETIGKRLGLRILGTLTKPFRATDIRRFLETEQHQPKQILKQSLASEINIEDVLAGLERREFDAFLQPIMDLATNQPIGYEALARWQSEKFSLLTPDRFIAVAARHGILPLLTHQILDRALDYAVALRERNMVWKVSVNLGVEDLLDNELPEKLAEMVSDHDLPQGSLTVELTESSATANEITMLGTLARLRLKGIDLAIDDFGTCYSGLDRLSTIPFTSLKIDMRFITDMMTNKNARMIVESSIALAKRLKMKTVAEGIETESQLALLKNMRCDCGQGYLFAPPMEFQKLLVWNQVVFQS